MQLQPTFSYIDNELRDRSSGALDFVKALHSAKEAQEKFKKTEFADRGFLLKRFAELINESKTEIVQQEARSSGLPEDFCFHEVVDPAQKYIENLSIEVQIFSRPELLIPTGVIGISGPRTLAFLYQAKWIANSLASGSAVILRPDPEQILASLWLARILNKLDLPKGLVQILNGDPTELDPLLAGHPGLQAYIFSGSFQNSEKLIAESSLRKKKVHFLLGAKNSALVHPEFDFKKNIQQILRPALIGMGRLDVNTHRFFVSQSVEKEFYACVQDALKSFDIKTLTEGFKGDARQIYQSAVDRVIPEEGKLLVQGPPTFTSDLPNCSDLQQDQIPGPLFIVTAVKYVHEMVKWSNTGYHGHSAVIWGPEDKARNLAVQLQVGHVSINRWAGFSDWAVPVKQSFWGNPDLKWSGTFYNDVKKLT